ncbi:MAG: hypothetical protein M1823_000578 [Watsoniomyces obsoletus]|nr:MAG: hypothetical protein M1823_000578 [Watsoniomyces obsoletus]
MRRDALALLVLTACTSVISALPHSEADDHATTHAALLAKRNDIPAELGKDDPFHVPEKPEDWRADQEHSWRNHKAWRQEISWRRIQHKLGIADSHLPADSDIPADEKERRRNEFGACMKADLQNFSPDAQDLFPGLALFQEYLEMHPKLSRERLLQILPVEDDCVEEAIAQTPYGKISQQNRLAYEKEVGRWFDQRRLRSNGTPTIPPPRRERPPRQDQARQVKSVRLASEQQRSLNRFVQQIQSTDVGQMVRDSWRGVAHGAKLIKPPQAGTLLAIVQKGVRAPKLAPAFPM